jgi:spermidine/putrescine transport system substrate-binding protein
MQHDNHGEDPTRSTRRAFLGRSASGIVALSGAGSLLAACGGSSSGGVVNVLSFESYIDPTVKKLWEKAYPNITLQGTPAGNDAELLTKLRAGGDEAYDVVFCDFGFCPIYHREGLVETLNLAEQPAGKQLYPQFRQDVKAFPYLLAPDQAIGMPCEWAPTALTFNTTVSFKPEQPYRWSDLWSPQLPEGKVGFEGLPPEGNIATAALAKGFPASRVYSLNQSELNEIVAYFRQIKPFRTFEADPEMRDALRTGTVWAGLVPTPGFASKINEEAGKTVTKSVIPEEGSIGFIDGPMLVKNAKNRQNALKFINWFGSDPALRDYIFEAYRAAPCNQPTVERLLKKGGEQARLVTELKGPEPELATKIVQGQPPENPKAYAAAWDAILA